MAELVGGAVLQAVFALLFERLTPKNAEFLNFIRAKKLDNNLLHRLKPSLNAARSVLNDAELKQFKDPAVRDWLDDLRDAVYQVEDFMDDISTIIHSQNQVCNLSSASLTVRDTGMANKLEAIAAKIEFIVAQKDLLGLKTSVEPKNLSHRTQSTCRVKVSDVCGREKEKDAIIKLLSDNSDKLSVIPIVGMGGIGKTTLAQLVYNDDYVKQNFDLRAWVCVSEAFDLLKITQTIIKIISPSHPFDIVDLNLLQLDLEEMLSKKKFFVVLDDVWNDKYTDWDTLMTPFHYGVEGSKILVTTRSERVASMVETVPPFYRLGLLSDEDCLSVFATHAFRSSDSSSNFWLDKFGRDIVSKCKGLPLAAKALGGLFRSKPIQQWNIILKNDLWDLVEDEIVPALRVGYHYLPPHLKQCIVYCSLFPKDYKFDKEDLVLMWIAEGFLQPSNRGMMTLEEVGYDYFDDLTSRSFFQPSIEVNGLFVMHDLIHDLTISVGRDFFFRLEKEGEGNKIDSRARHMSYVNLNFPTVSDIEALKGAKYLRTILGFHSKWLPGSVGNTIMVLDLKYMRVLSFDGFSALKTIPDSIGEFVHLHYLNLSSTGIECLPDSLCKLYNLQTLKLCVCLNLKMLPNGMRDLVNLRCLRIWKTHKLEEMPRGMSKLRNLQVLDKFIVGKEEGTAIQELGGFENLKGTLDIRNLENVKSSNEAHKASIIKKKHIKHLRLCWSSDDCISDSQTVKDIIDNLQPHGDLESLTIMGYKGTIFPNWLEHGSFHHMTSLRLLNCKNCWKLPPLGRLPALKDLSISGLEKVVTIGAEFFKGDDCASMIPFVSLETFFITCMAAWEKWHSSIEMEAFPKLQQVYIEGCPKLTGDLPCQLVSLKSLKIVNCPLLASFIPRCPEISRLEILRSPNLVLQDQELPPSLHTLTVSGGRMMETAFEAMAHSEIPKLQTLSLLDCSNNAMSLAAIHIPQSVKELQINRYKEMELPITTSGACDILTSLPNEIFQFLNILHVHECENLTCVLVSNTPVYNLQNISISYCLNLKRLSDDTEYLLPNLKVLSIDVCPKVEPFPKGFLPSSLTELHVHDCEELLAHHREWNLASITSLSITSYSNIIKVECFPEGSSLPATLTTLSLICLQSLHTLNCEGLQHLTSLHELKIYYSHKVEKLTGEMLPTSLRKLIINSCDLLEQRCRNKDDQIWPKISHIPAIRLTHEWISFDIRSK